ncbi:MAG: 50S ribosomal protein L10 [Lachnospiraceae bacterium]|nr:50S ribosomal protein L10 [Lachnospiraceae bacterium]
MAKTEQKKVVIDAISKSLSDASSVVLVDYRGLTVEQDTALRKQLREAGVHYKVYKNTMMNFAIKGTQFECLGEHLKGPSGCAMSSEEDPVAAARVLSEFAKKADKLEIKCGVIEGTLYDAAGVQELSNIPTREVLLSKLLGSIQSPITNFARCMKQLAEKGGASGDEGAAEAPAEEVKAEAPAEEAKAEAPAEEAPAAEEKQEEKAAETTDTSAAE